MQRTHGLKFTLTAIVLLVATVLALSARGSEDPKAPAAAQKPTTIVLVRHAEKDPQGDARDPGLSADGKARAERLAKMFASAGVTHLFASEFHRTQDTLGPLAAKSAKKVEVVPGGKKEELFKALEAVPAGSIAVVAGHSNTVPAVAAHFGVELAGTTKSAQGDMMPEDAFDRIYVLTVPAKESQGAPSLLELRY